MVHAELIKGAGLVSLSCLVGAIQIASADLWSGEAVFSGSTSGKPVSGFVQDIPMDGGHWLSDGDIGFPGADGEQADTAAVLRRSIAVDNRIAET